MAESAHKIAGISGGRDENKIITIIQPWWCPTVDECFVVGDATMKGLPESRRDFGVWDPDLADAGYQIGLTYQGPDPDVPDEDTETFDLETEEASQPIETHHNLNEIMEKWGGRLEETDGEQKVVFDKELLSSGFGEGGFVGPPAPTDFETNPYFGRKTYDLYGSIWTHTYVRRSIPSDLLSRVRSVVKSPPGNPPTPDGREWAIASPQMTVYPGGSGVRITDRYKLSPPNGWPPGLLDTLVI